MALFANTNRRSARRTSSLALREDRLPGLPSLTRNKATEIAALRDASEQHALSNGRLGLRQCCAAFRNLERRELVRTKKAASDIFECRL